MTYPAITAFWAGLFGLLYVAFTAWVMFSRVQSDTLFGDGSESLSKRIRSHGNFQEYVPITLLLIALLEAGGAAPGLVRGLLIALFVARLLHPIGLFAPKNSVPQFACRGGGSIVTMVVLVVAAIDLLVR